MARIRRNKKRAVNSKAKSRARQQKKNTKNTMPKLRLQKKSVYAVFHLLLIVVAVYAVYLFWSSNQVQTTLKGLESAFMQTQQSLDLVVGEVLVTGRQHTDLQQLYDTAGIKTGTPIFKVDLKAIKSRVETLPWIKNVAVVRQMPRTIYIHITEHEPFALWQREDELYIVNNKGEIITRKTGDQFDDLMLVVGSNANVEAGTLLGILEQSPALSKRIVAGIRVANRRWNLLIDNGVFVNLPEENPHIAFKELAELEAKHQILQKDIRVIDMRLPDRLIIQMLEEGKQNERGQPFEQKT